MRGSTPLTRRAQCRPNPRPLRNHEQFGKSECFPNAFARARVPALHTCPHNRQFWPGNKGSRQGLRPLRIRTSQPEGCLIREVSVTNHHWPCEVRAGERAAAVCRLTVEATAAYATQRCYWSYLDCAWEKLVTDVTKRRPNATQAV